MGSVANRDAAEQALRAGQRKLEVGDTDGAKRMVTKSLGLYETPEGHALERAVLEAVEQAEAVKRVLEAPDLFAVLGVARSVTSAEAKKAYFSLSKLIHPDKNRHAKAQEAFQRLGTAYTTLSDQVERNAYAMKNQPRPNGKHKQAKPQQQQQQQQWGPGWQPQWAPPQPPPQQQRQQQQHDGFSSLCP